MSLYFITQVGLNEWGFFDLMSVISHIKNVHHIDWGGGRVLVTT